MDKNNLKTLKELILDEENLITYISLSKNLGIHVNEAKLLLRHAIKEIRECEPKTVINVCYMISGVLYNNSTCTTVCPEADIETLRKTLKIIFYQHIYCVSRGGQGIDNVALTAIHLFEDFSLCTGLIKANSCIKRTGDEIGNLKSNSNQVVSIEVKTKLNVSKNQAEISKETSHHMTVNVNEIKSESKAPSPKKDEAINNNKANVNKNGIKPAKGIAGFFNKINVDSTKIKNTNVKLEENREIEVIQVKIEKKETTESSKPTQISNKIKKEESDTKNKTRNVTSSNSSLKQIKKNAKVDKKRKRVLRVSDSESETDTNDPFADNDKKIVEANESEEEIPPTPTVNTVKITSGIVNPKKRRKIVDKTYTSEDGFMLTKKEEVYESFSENEEEIKPCTTQEKENMEQVIKVKIESPQKVKSRKKISPPQKGKQQTLTNFFKKA